VYSPQVHVNASAPADGAARLFNFAICSCRALLRTLPSRWRMTGDFHPPMAWRWNADIPASRARVANWCRKPCRVTCFSIPARFRAAASPEPQDEAPLVLLLDALARVPRALTDIERLPRAEPHRHLHRLLVAHPEGVGSTAWRESAPQCATKLMPKQKGRGLKIGPNPLFLLDPLSRLELETA